MKRILLFAFLLIPYCYCLAQRPEIVYKKGLETTIPKETIKGNDLAGKGNSGERPGERNPAMSKTKPKTGQWPQFVELQNGNQLSDISFRYINRMRTLVLGIKGLQSLLVGSSLIGLYSEEPKDFIGNNISSIIGVYNGDIVGLAEGIYNLDKIKSDQIYDNAASAMVDLDGLAKDFAEAKNFDAVAKINREYGFWNTLANSVYKTKEKNKKTVIGLPDPDAY